MPTLYEAVDLCDRAATVAVPASMVKSTSPSRTLVKRWRMNASSREMWAHNLRPDSGVSLWHLGRRVKSDLVGHRSRDPEVRDEGARCDRGARCRSFPG